VRQQGANKAGRRRNEPRIIHNFRAAHLRTKSEGDTGESIFVYSGIRMNTPYSSPSALPGAILEPDGAAG
jgi:hypothetical protein